MVQDIRSRRVPPRAGQVSKKTAQQILSAGSFFRQESMGGSKRDVGNVGGGRSGGTGPHPLRHSHTPALPILFFRPFQHTRP